MSVWAIAITLMSAAAAIGIAAAVWTAGDDRRRWKRTTATRGDSWGDRPPHETRPGRIDQQCIDLEALYNQPAHDREAER